MAEVNSIVLKKSIIVSNSEFQLNKNKIKIVRTMDVFTSKLLYVLSRLGDLTFADKDRTGAVIATNTGPRDSLIKTGKSIEKSGYRGINPSFFPNVMLSTALSYLMIYLNIHGASSAIYSTPDCKDAIAYCKMQIKNNNCDDMLFFYIDESKDAKGQYFTKVFKEVKG